jgi:hypothetical protein
MTQAELIFQETSWDDKLGVTREAVRRCLTEDTVLKNMIRNFIKASFAARVPRHFEKQLSRMTTEKMKAHDEKEIAFGTDWRTNLATTVGDEDADNSAWEVWN